MLQKRSRSVSPAARPGVRRRLAWGCGAAASICAALTALHPAARESAMALCNEVFAASEAVNSYVYERLPTAAGADPTLALILAIVACAALTGLAFLTKGSWTALLLAGGLIAGQAWLGLSLSAPVNVLWLGLLALAVAVRHAGRQAILPFAAGVLAVALAVGLLAPGTDPAIEAASERVRDWLAAAPLPQVPAGGEDTPDLLETRHENRRDLLEGENEAQTAQAYALVTVDEEQFALPHWADYLRMALLCLLIPVLLAAPFVPFWWLNRQSGRAARRLACLDAEDPAEAILGMFDLVIGYLDACRVGDANALYLHRLPADCALPADYQALYREAAAIWQEAAYSGHALTPAQRETTARLLAETERIFYDEADLRTRLYLRCVRCLHE